MGVADKLAVAGVRSVAHTVHGLARAAGADVDTLSSV